MIKSVLLGSIATIGFGVLILGAGYADMTANAKIRVESARFYTADGGTIVTEDGNEWWYTAKTLHDAFVCTDGSVVFNSFEYEARNNVPVWVRISDNGTPDEIGDDEILAVGMDFSAYIDESIDATEIAIRHNWEFIDSMNK